MIDPTTRDAYAKRVGSLCSDCSVLTASVLSDINQVFYGDGPEGNLSATNLSVRYVTGQEYHNLVTGASGQFEPKTLYVMSSDQINAYNTQIKNVANPEEEKDAANKWYVDYACESALTIVEESIDEDLHNYYKQSETSSSSEISAAFENALSADVVKIGTGASVPPQTSTAGQVRSVAIGYGANANDSAVDGSAQGVAVGPDANAAEASTAIGSQSNANNDKCVAVGYQADATGTHSSSSEQNTENIESTAIGCLAKATGQQSTCIGSQSQAAGSMSVALGKGAKATGDSGIAAGNGSSAAQEGIAIGLNAKTATRGVSIGSGANNGNPQPRTVSIGNNSKASADGATALGYNTNAAGKGSIAIGGGFVNSSSDTYKSSAQALNDYSTAIGQGAVASANDAVQIGRGTNLSSGTLQFKDYIIIDSAGKIPAERFQDTCNGFILDCISALSSANAVSSYYDEITTHPGQQTLFIVPNEQFKNASLALTAQVPATSTFVAAVGAIVSAISLAGSRYYDGQLN